MKGAAGTQLQLWVNGEQVSEKRIGKRAVLPSLQVSGLDFIGVDLHAGRNVIEVRQVDMMGNARDTKRIEVVRLINWISCGLNRARLQHKPMVMTVLM